MNFWDFLLEESGDMVERGLIMAAIVVVAVALWFGIGNQLAERLTTVQKALK